MKKKKKTISKHKRLLWIALGAAALCLVAGIALGTQKVRCSEEVRIYVTDNTDYAALRATLDGYGVIAHPRLFDLMAQFRGLRRQVRSGSYVVRPGMTYIRLIQKLYTGNQDAIRLTINKHRTLRELCDFLGSHMQFTGEELMAVLADKEFAATLGCTPQNIISVFTQNTYEVYWNTCPKKFVERMAMETDAFWSDGRDKQREALGLTRAEVVTLASIVDEETLKDDEKPTIASVYLNRLRRGMKLEADPTVKYAVGDFTLRRILGVHLKKDSPYNTYMYKGLPPGPICLPAVASIDAVLANKQTNYIYFCAKEDFSGRHNFAATYSQHQANAKRFHNALNERKIYK